MVSLLPAFNTLLVAIVASLAAGSARTEAASPPGTFRVITHNVAGLPPFINDNGVPGSKQDNTREIGRRFFNGPWDVVNVQEDFNFHKYLYETATNFEYRSATTGGVPWGSGLNTLARYPTGKIQRFKWNRCNLSGGDCLSAKGFTMIRSRLPGGAEVDFYNVHTDAGDEPGDSAARLNNLYQVSNYIKKYSAGRALVIFGDTNSRYTRVNDKFQAWLNDNAGFKDAWVELVRGAAGPPAPGSPAIVCNRPVPKDTSCEVVDKVIYRSGDKVKLQATEWGFPATQFLSATGTELSDHIPVAATFTYKVV